MGTIPFVLLVLLLVLVLVLVLLVLVLVCSAQHAVGAVGRARERSPGGCR